MTALIRTLPYVLLVMLAAGCTSRESELRQHEQQLESLRATSRAIAEAWLNGSLSRTYARTALDRTYVLVEQEREKLGTPLAKRLDPEGARLFDAAEQLSRVVATLQDDVEKGDVMSVRGHLSQSSRVASRQP